VVTRFKGLGEMNPPQLRETTIDPRTRRLVQLTIEAKDQTDQADGHAAGQEARRRPARLAGDATAIKAEVLDGLMAEGS
jgi:DNA gyrase/topoisomerase IV subunit B